MSSRGGPWYRFIRWVAREIAFRSLGGIRVIGRELVPMEGPLLVAPVHFSYLDPPIVACAMDRALSFMAKEDLFRPWWLGPLIRSLGSFPVRRGENDTEAIRLAIHLLKEGRAVLLFPEGTRGFGEKMGGITPGIAMLAKRSGAKVLPVGIVGTERVWPKGSKKLRRSPMTVVIGRPFTYDAVATNESDRENRVLFSRELARRIAELCERGGLPIKVDASNLPTTGSDSDQTPISGSGV